jgi:hypothetical protein
MIALVLAITLLSATVLLHLIDICRNLKITINKPKMPRIIKIIIGLAIAKMLWSLDIMYIINKLIECGQ